LRTRPIKVPAARHEPPTEEEIKRLLASDLEPKTRAVIEMARFTGARRGEILGLTWGDLDFEERRLGIKRVIERPKEGIRIREGGKTASATRNIIMPAPLVEAMKIWRLRQKEDALRVGLPWSSQCFLFPARDNLHWPVDPDLMTKTIRRAMDRVGVRPEVSPFHGFRHFLGSALMGVVPDKVISEVLGHSTPAITQKLYQQGLESHHRAAAEKTAEVLDFTRKKPHREG
jgi:integrase